MHWPISPFHGVGSLSFDLNTETASARFGPPRSISSNEAEGTSTRWYSELPAKLYFDADATLFCVEVCSPVITTLDGVGLMEMHLAEVQVRLSADGHQLEPIPSGFCLLDAGVAVYSPSQTHAESVSVYRKDQWQLRMPRWRAAMERQAERDARRLQRKNDRFGPFGKDGPMK